MTTGLQAQSLSGVRHGFFTRHGGTSGGLYASLNCGLGSADERASVLKNRAIVARALGVAAERLVTVYQAHTATCLVVNEPFDAAPPQADALVTTVPGLALAVSSADCTPILLVDPRSRIIGAIHAGWRGAVKGVVQAAIEKMKGEGAEPSRIVAAIGPTIRQPSYEVGPEVIEACKALDAANTQFFVPSKNAGRAMFDLPGFVAGQLKRAGVTQIEDLGRDTYAEEDLFFSYRRATHRGEADYGRHLHAIALGD